MLAQDPLFAGYWVNICNIDTFDTASSKKENPTLGRVCLYTDEADLLAGRLGLFLCTILRRLDRLFTMRDGDSAVVLLTNVLVNSR